MGAAECSSWRAPTRPFRPWPCPPPCQRTTRMWLNTTPRRSWAARETQDPDSIPHPFLYRTTQIERQIAHLICARLKYDLYDFFRRAQIRWVIWRSSNIVVCTDRGRVNREVQTVNWEAGKKGAVETGVKSGRKKVHKPWIRGKKDAQTVNQGAAFAVKCKPWIRHFQPRKIQCFSSQFALHGLRFLEQKSPFPNLYFGGCQLALWRLKLSCGCFKEKGGLWVSPKLIEENAPHRRWAQLLEFLP